ncbi:hypothetical protein [Halobaculum sp. MBLA0143]|uniref:hypothetical protein n=1 Tax=Halobaculum sp. MBLA0143 TaxID=3079933 RepID=UPI003523C3D0
MSEVYTAWWIDDDPDREESAEVFEEGSNRLVVKFERASEVAEKLWFESESTDGEDRTTSANGAARVSDESVDIILLDWKLYEDGRFGGTGKSIVGVLREEFSETPVYGLSSQPDFIDESVFDDTFDVDRLVGAAEQVVSDIDDYRRIEANGESIETLVGCLNPPETDTQQLERLVPRKFTGGLTDADTETGVEFAGWVRDDLLPRPGLLLNRTWTATKLGVEQNVLDDREHVLTDADVENQTYSGVFEPSETLWWKSKLIDTLVDVDIEEGGSGQFTNTWEKGAELLDADAEERSTCVVCNESFPETVAAATAGEEYAQHPVHFRCSDVYKSRMGAYADFRVANKL